MKKKKRKKKKETTLKRTGRFFGRFEVKQYGKKDNVFAFVYPI